MQPAPSRKGARRPNPFLNCLLCRLVVYTMKPAANFFSLDRATVKSMKPCRPGYLWLFAYLATLAPALIAQDAESKPTELAEKRFALFAEQAGEIELVPERSQRRLQIREKPLQTFSADGSTFGSVFLWKAEDGRPAAIGTIGSLPIDGRDFGFTELHWLLEEPLTKVVIGKYFPKQWSASGDGLTPKAIPASDTPTGTNALRLTQMRAFARNFTAQMAHAGATHQLRLLPQPLYRYDEPSAETDGAIFAYVWTVGTDPELLIHIQTRKHEGQLRWFYQPIRFSWRKLELAYDGAAVWSAEELLSRNDLLQNGPYITTLTEAIK